MSYIVKQKIHGRTYAYEAEIIGTLRRSSLDRKTPLSRHLDEATGQIIPKTAERDVKTTKSFGPSYLIDSVGNEIQIRKNFSMILAKTATQFLR